MAGECGRVRGRASPARGGAEPRARGPGCEPGAGLRCHRWALCHRGGRLDPEHDPGLQLELQPVPRGRRDCDRHRDGSVQPGGGANHTLSSIDATLSTLDDVELWLEARTTLNAEAQSRLDSFLEGHGAGTLTEEEEADLQSLLGSYGRLTVRKAHAWLLLGRRGYRVPPQEPDQE